MSQVLTFFPAAEDNLWLTGNEPSSVDLCFDTKADDCRGLGRSAVVGSWVHVAAVFANAPVSNSLLFVNGQLVTATCVFGGCKNDTSVTTSVDLGGFSPFGYDGLLDEVRIYDRALTASEVTALYDLCP